jgi:hypothetical protein
VWENNGGAVRFYERWGFQKVGVYDFVGGRDIQKGFVFLRDVQGAALLKQVSPVAWQHINLYSRYEFSKRPELINMDAITQELAQVPVQQDLTGQPLEYTDSAVWAKIPRLKNTTPHV